jgi:hypothetical protein
VVTHPTTNPPVQCLNMAERTGSLIFIVLWSYVVNLPRRLLHVLFMTIFTYQTVQLVSLPSCQLVQFTHRFAFSLMYFLQNLHLTCFFTMLSSDARL